MACLLRRSGQTKTYPLVVDGTKYYFDWPSRRAAVECLEEVQREFVRAKIRMRKQQVLRSEAAEKKAGKGKRLAQRREAPVSAAGNSRMQREIEKSLLEIQDSLPRPVLGERDGAPLASSIEMERYNQY